MIDVEPDDAVTTVRLSRPARRNALTPAMLDDLADAVEAAGTPVTYLTGAGSAFSAGADFDVVDDLDGEAAAEFARLGQRTASAIEEAETVVVAGVDGPARGGGVELALACDLRIATPSASFAETGVSLGLFGAWGGTVRLPRAVPEAVAFDLALSGRTLDADEALRVGLVSRVVDDPRAVAVEVAANDPRSLRVLKDRLRDDDDRETRERREADAFRRLVERRNGDDPAQPAGN